MLGAGEDSSLANNYFSVVLVHLNPTERRLERAPDLRAGYAQSIKNDFDKGYTVKVDKSDCCNIDEPRECFILNHLVLHPHKPVLNGAAEFHSGSLIIVLFTVPDVLQTLIHVLMRFGHNP